MNKIQTLKAFVLILSLTIQTTIWSQTNQEKDNIEILISTFLGNSSRNYYGNKAPENLNPVWKLYLGEGVSPAYGKQKVWKGAGWTGQPLLVRENNELFLIQGAFDYNLKKIKAN